MKYFVLIIASGMLLSGCAQEAYYVDHEFGMAQNDAFDRQIVHKDYAHANKPVEGLDGIYAESIMEAYHETFSDSFSSEDIDVTATGSN